MHGGVVRLAQNHDQDQWGTPSVAAPSRLTYDSIAGGGVTTLVLDPVTHDVMEHRVALAGALRVGPGAPTPWGTWLACERTEHPAVGRFAADHGWVFEVDPMYEANNLDPEPIAGMGRFAHAGAAVDHERGQVYLPESGSNPNGLLYRYRPSQRVVGYGDLREGGTLEALVVDDVPDVAARTSVGEQLLARWAPVPDPSARRTSVRKQFDHLQYPTRTIVAGPGGPVTRWPRLERVRWAADRLWIVCGRVAGAVDWSDHAHGGQVWSFDPATSLLQLARCDPTRPSIAAPACVACAAATSSGPTSTALSVDRRTLYAGLPDEGATVAIHGPFEGHH